MKSIDPHRQCLEPLLDQIPIDVVQVTAQIASHEGGQVAHAIDGNCRLRQVVFLGQLAEKRGCWIRSTSLGELSETDGDTLVTGGLEVSCVLLDPVSDRVTENPVSMNCFDRELERMRIEIVD